MVRWLALAAALCGCYHPSPPEGVACSADEHCPAPYHCFDGECRTTRLPDAAPDATSAVGCADDEREAYADVVAFPTIAGCAASWTGEHDLRAPRTGGRCGDDVASCAEPADACAAGWHICAVTGEIEELLALTPMQCATEPGAFVAASAHCSADSPCKYERPYPCPTGAADCSQPICCGADCDMSNGCKNGVWMAATSENANSGRGCGNTPAANQDGVLCCRDPG